MMKTSYVFSGGLRRSEENFKYFCMYGESMSDKSRIEHIKEFNWDTFIGRTVLADGLYRNEVERKLLLDEIFKGAGSNVIDLFMKGFKFTDEERKIAVDLIYKHPDPMVHTWFLGCNPTEEERKLILSVMPEDRTIHGCYMYLMHTSKVKSELRERAFQSMLDRGVIYYLESIMTAPHVCNPSWVPSKEHKARVQARLDELRNDSKTYKGTVVSVKGQGWNCYAVKVPRHKKIYTYPTGWTPKGGVHDGVTLEVRIKDSEIIEILNYKGRY